MNSEVFQIIVVTVGSVLLFMLLVVGLLFTPIVRFMVAYLKYLGSFLQVAIMTIEASYNRFKLKRNFRRHLGKSSYKKTVSDDEVNKLIEDLENAFSQDKSLGKKDISK